MANDKIKTIKIRLSLNEWFQLELAAKAYGYKTVTAYVANNVKTSLIHSQQPPPALERAAVANHNLATTTDITVDDDDKLDQPIIVDGDDDTTYSSSGGYGNISRIPIDYVVRGERGYPLYKTAVSNVRMCVVDDDLLWYDLKHFANTRRWRDVSNELTPFERTLFDAWRNGFKWMYLHFNDMLRKTDNMPRIEDYKDLLMRYNLRTA